MAKLSGMKVKLYIHDGVDGQLLAGQRNGTLNQSAVDIFSIDCDRAYIVDDVAYQTLETKFVNSENVVAYLEMPSGRKLVGECTITDMSLEANFDDLSTYSISLQGSGALSKLDAETAVV